MSLIKSAGKRSKRNLNWTLPFSTATAMKSLWSEREGVCPCHSSSPLGCSVMTVISMASSLCLLCLNRDRGSSMKPPDAENSAVVDIGSMSDKQQRQTTTQFIITHIGVARIFFIGGCTFFLIKLTTFLPRCMECNAVLTMRFLSVRPSVCPSVCPFVKRVHCDKTEEKSVRIFIPCERPLCLLLWEEEWLVGGGDPFYLKFWVNRPAMERNRRFWTDNRS